MFNFATTIQKHWRGHQQRSQTNLRQVYVDSDSEPIPQNGNNFTTSLDSTSCGLETKDEKPTSSLPAHINIPAINIPKPTGSTKVKVNPASSSSGDDLYTEDYNESNNNPTTAQPKHASVQLPFNKQYNLDIIIDGAVGLPITTTATRIHVKMHMPTRDVVADISPHEHCDLMSDYANPFFRFRHQWKGKQLHPTMTIIVYIETLESISLLPRTVGIAALRLCVDHVGLQPLSEVFYDDRPSCFFNTGQFAVPILYGSLADMDDQVYISEAKMQELLPQIEGAYLRIGLLATRPGDQVIDKPFPSAIMRDSSTMSSVRTETSSRNSEEGVNLYSNNVCSVLWKTFIATQLAQQTQKNAQNAQHANSNALYSVLGNANTHSVYNMHKLNISPGISNRFQQGEMLSDGERNEVMREIRIYVQKSFDHEMSHLTSSPAILGGHSIHASVHSVHSSVHSSHSVGQMHSPNTNSSPLTSHLSKPLISPQFLVEYADYSGVWVGLDMLYNMPERKELIEAAERAASVAAMKSGLSRGWDDKISYFKTVFRYLPGKVPDASAATGAGSGGYRDEVDGVLKMQSVHESSMTDGELIIDDASVKPYLNSSELSPAYTDEYSSTAGMKLGPYSCVLIVVTAVDVLTREGGMDSKSAADDMPAPSISPVSSRASLLHNKDSSTRSLGSSSGIHHTPRNQSSDQQPTKKLKGLGGIFVGHNDPKATWWTLVPLFRTLPPHLLHTINTSKPVLTKVASRSMLRSPASGLMRALSPKNLLSPKAGAGAAKEGHRTAENSVSVSKMLMGNGAGDAGDVVREFSTPDIERCDIQSVPSNSTAHISSSTSSTSGGRGVGLTVDTSSSPNSLKEGGALRSPKSAMSPTNVTAYDKLLTSNPSATFSYPLYINDGTHQMPLFEGLPPEEMVYCPNPMLWLVNQVNKQVQSQTSGNQNGESPLQRFLAPILSLFMGSDGSGGSRKKKKKKKDDVKLSQSSCAIVRIGNPRMKKTAPSNIVEMQDKYIDRYLLDYFLRLFAQSHNPQQTIVRSPSHAGNNLSTVPPVAIGQQGSVKSSTTMDILSSMVSSSSGPGSITVTYYLVNLPHYARVLNNVAIDGSKYRSLKNAFIFGNTHALFSSQNYTQSTLGSPGHRYSNSKHNHKDKRVLQKLMSGEGLEAKELVAQINQKFYQTISG